MSKRPRLRFVVELFQDDDGCNCVTVNGGGRGNKADTLEIMHAFGAAMHLDRMDWYYLSATCDLDMHAEGVDIRLPVTGEDK